MPTLTCRPVKNIGYTPPEGYKFEYSKFQIHDVELDDNELEASSDEEKSDKECEEQSDCITTDDSSSELSESDVPLFTKKRTRRQIPEKVYTVILQEEEFLPE